MLTNSVASALQNRITISDKNTIFTADMESVDSRRRTHVGAQFSQYLGHCFRWFLNLTQLQRSPIHEHCDVRFASTITKPIGYKDEPFVKPRLGLS